MPAALKCHGNNELKNTIYILLSLASFLCWYLLLLQPDASLAEAASSHVTAKITPHVMVQLENVPVDVMTGIPMNTRAGELGRDQDAK